MVDLLVELEDIPVSVPYHIAKINNNWKVLIVPQTIVLDKKSLEYGKIIPSNPLYLSSLANQ